MLPRPERDHPQSSIGFCYDLPSADPMPEFYPAAARGRYKSNGLPSSQPTRSVHRYLHSVNGTLFVRREHSTTHLEYTEAVFAGYLVLSEYAQLSTTKASGPGYCDHLCFARLRSLPVFPSYCLLVCLTRLIDPDQEFSSGCTVSLTSILTRTWSKMNV